MEKELQQVKQQLGQVGPLIARHDELEAAIKAAKAVREQRNAAKRAELEAAQERARAAQERVRQLQADLEGDCGSRLLRNVKLSHHNPCMAPFRRMYPRRLPHALR